MSIKLAGRLFTGPFPVESSEVRANQIPAVFAVVAKGGQPWAPVFRVVDIDATPDAGLRLADHPRYAAWTADAGESIGVYFFYAPRSEFTQADRERMAEELRGEYEPPNGFVG
jgi:hypothetical protein